MFALAILERAAPQAKSADGKSKHRLRYKDRGAAPEIEPWAKAGKKQKAEQRQAGQPDWKNNCRRQLPAGQARFPNHPRPQVTPTDEHAGDEGTKSDAQDIFEMKK